MGFVILGHATNLPEHAIGRDESVEFARTICCESPKHEKIVPVLYRRSGVDVRYSALLQEDDGRPSRRFAYYPPRTEPGDRGPTTAARMATYVEEVPGLLLPAVRRALEAADVPPQTVTHLVTVSCTGFMNPGLDLMLIEGLGFDRGIERTHVGFMGCHGFLNGLRVAKALAEADPDAVVVTCAVEICSLHYRYGWDQDGLVANALFADGAACVVGVGDRHRRATQPTGPDAAVTGTGSFVVPDSADAMTWHVRDYGFEMTLSATVPDLIGENVRPWVESWLSKRGLTIGDIGSWAVHPGGPRILTATAEALGLPDDALDVSTEVLRTHGNMSSPTLMFVLDGLWRQGRPTPTVALGFGPGLAVEATLFGPRNV